MKLTEPLHSRFLIAPGLLIASGVIVHLLWSADGGIAEGRLPVIGFGVSVILAFMGGTIASQWSHPFGHSPVMRGIARALIGAGIAIGYLVAVNGLEAYSHI